MQAFLDNNKSPLRYRSAGVIVILINALLSLSAHAEPNAVWDSSTTPPTTGTFLLDQPASWLHTDVTAYARAEAVADAPTPDLLARLRNRFTLPVLEKPRTRSQIAWFTRHPSYFDRVLTRAQPYMHHIVSELEARDMPAELALLPIVESAFDPFAYSHGRAAGLWQIIPSTGRRFGLKQDWWYDGRRDVLEATRAALDYLQFLAKRYDGDYELAVAAYNSGEGTVDRAIRRNKKAGKPTDFWSLRLPAETSSYVPRLLALAEIFAHPERHGIILKHMEDAPQIMVVETSGQIDLALAAELAAVPLDTLYRLNPGYNQWATSPDGPHKLVVPVENAEHFALTLAAVPANERMRWTRHKVSSGQAISQIAEQYGTTVREIRTANKLRNNTIRAGQHLMIPTASKPLSEYSQSASERLARLQNKPRGESRLTHRVNNGESLWSIAQRYGVESSQLAKWNGMAPRDTLSVGRELVVWTNGEQAGAAATGPELTRRVRYTVRRGDSLSLIASRFRVRVSDIAKWNSLNTGKILRPGQTLKLYVDVTRQSS